MYEPLAATAERLWNTFGLKYDLTPDQLNRLQQGYDIPDHLKEQVKEFVSQNRLSYKSSWTEIDEMVNELMDDRWRMQYADDFGQGYIFNWFILDYVGFETNPRRRAFGFHAIFEHYQTMLQNNKRTDDRLYWHYHPVSFFLEAHKSCNNFSNSNLHLQIWARRIIDHLHFPVAFRPGCHTERPDINLFLEQWIPFDFGNQGMKERQEDQLQQDLAGGRYGDWRRAVDDWETYHPDFYDYQKKGTMKRYIARCLNLDARLRPITEPEIERAFQRADAGKPTILAITNHDSREMRPAVDWFMKTVRAVQVRYPEVKIVHSNAVQAIRRCENMPEERPTELSFRWDQNWLFVTADKPIWGPQPFLCFKTLDQRYYFENFDFQGDLSWSFVFDQETVRLDQLESIGVATNDNYGNTSVYVLSADQNLEKTRSRLYRG